MGLVQGWRLGAGMGVGEVIGCLVQGVGTWYRSRVGKPGVKDGILVQGVGGWHRRWSIGTGGGNLLHGVGV